jgi:hypothetical protein
MASIIANLATGAAQAAHAHAAALLASQQAKSGDKLPLNETLKETDATTPITLAPTGKTIFVRLPHPACASFISHPSFPPSLVPPFFSLFFFVPISPFIRLLCMHITSALFY